jgi:hypothetical protein
MDKKKLVKYIEECIQTISEEEDSINDDCRDQGGPIPALLYGRLKSYKECREMFSDLLYEIEEGELSGE